MTLPQTSTTQTTTSRTLLEIPSKTYKLNIDTGNYITFVRNDNLPTFEMQNGHLIVNYLSEEPTFSIQGNNLYISGSNIKNIEDYRLVDGHMYYEGTIDCDDRIIGYVDRLEAIKQAVYHILMTERYAYLIYSGNYGVEFEQYKGKPFSYLEMTIENTLREALTYDLRIKNIQVDKITSQGDTALVEFTVFSIYGNLQMEVSIVV